MKIFIFILLVLLSQDISSQVIHGKIIDATNQPLMGCIITQHSINDSSIINYTSSAVDGSWGLKLHYHTYLRFNLMGYENQVRVVDNNINDTKTLLVKLESISFDLNEVIINATRAGIAKVGDTSKYDLKSFVTGQEKNLEDVINQLPGMDVNEEGDINYNGQRIDVLLMEAKDILNNQHKLATEGLKSEDIAGINIIENYKTSDEKLTNHSSDKVAMDVKLSEGAKARWRGNVTLEGGHKNKLTGGVNGFNINDKVSATAFSRYNNTGSQLMSTNDYLSLQTSISKTLNNNKNNLDNILPEYYLLPQDLQKNNDGLVAINLHYEKANGSDRKFNILLNRLNREGTSEFSRIFWLDNSTYNGSKTTNTHNTLLSSQYDEYWNLSDKTELSIALPFSFNHVDSETNVRGLFNTTSINSFNIFSYENFNLSPTMEFTHQVSDKWFYTLQSSLGIESLQEDKNVSGLMPLFDTPNNTINQVKDRSNTDFSFRFSTEYHSTVHSIGFSAAYVHNKVRFNSKSEDQLLGNVEVNFTRPIFDSQIFYQFKNDVFLFEPKLTMQSISTKLNENKAKSYLPGLELLSKYSFDKLHFLLLRGKYNDHVLPFTQLNPAIILVDNTSIRSNNTNIQHTYGSSGLQLSHFKYSLHSRSRTHTLVDYTMKKNGTYRIFDTNQSYTIERLGILDSEKSFSIRNTLFLPLFKNTIRLRNLVYISYNKRMLSEHNHIIDNTQRWQLSLSTNSKKAWNTEIGISLSNNDTENQNTSFKFNRNSYSWKLIFDEENLHISTSASLRSSNFQLGDKINYYQLDLLLNYSVSDQWLVKIRTNDLLNLNGTLNIFNEYRISSIQENSFIRFPGYILIGIEYSF